MSQHRNAEREKIAKQFAEDFKEEIARQKQLQAESVKLSTELTVLAEKRNMAIKEIEGISTSIQGLKGQESALKLKLEAFNKELAKDTSFLEAERARLRELEESINLRGANAKLYWDAKVKETKSAQEEADAAKNIAQGLSDKLEKSLAGVEAQKQEYVKQKVDLEAKGIMLDTQHKEILAKETEVRQLLAEVNTKQEENKQKDIEIVNRHTALNKRAEELDHQAQEQSEQEIFLQGRMQRINELIELYKLEAKLKKEN